MSRVRVRVRETTVHGIIILYEPGNDHARPSVPMSMFVSILSWYERDEARRGDAWQP
jgi:hypothetical protein